MTGFSCNWTPYYKKYYHDSEHSISYYLIEISINF